MPHKLSCEKCGKPVHVAGPTEETLEALRGTAVPEKLYFHVQARCSSSSLHLRSDVCLSATFGDVQAATQPFKVLARFVPRRSRSDPPAPEAAAPTPAAASVQSAPLQSPLEQQGEAAAAEPQQSGAPAAAGATGTGAVVVRVLRLAPVLWNLVEHVKCSLRLQLSRMPHLLSQDLTQFEDLIIVVARFSRRESALLADGEIARCLCGAGGMGNLLVTGLVVHVSGSVWSQQSPQQQPQQQTPHAGCKVPRTGLEPE
eukprot:m51a1_g1430 hypothetical protein (257) ;mRNA; f:75049-76337